MVIFSSSVAPGSIALVASPSSFWGLDKAGLITTIVVSVILIATVAWLINGTKRRD